MSIKNPNLFIIGAPKCGTTALALNLSSLSGIYLPEIKEPRFFDSHVFYDDPEDYPIKNIDDYLKLYDCKSALLAKYRVDASVFNMYSSSSIRAILDMQPDSKFIVILREPVSASVSMHKQRLKYPKGPMREISDDFITCWNKIDMRKQGEGYPINCKNKFLFRYDQLFSYEKYLPEILNIIPKEQLFIGFYEDYVNDSEVFFSQLFGFINVDGKGFNNAVRNESGILRDTWFSRFLYRSASFTLKARKTLGLTGKNISWFKVMLASRLYAKPARVKQDLSCVSDFFYETKKYMNEIKAGKWL